MAKLAEFPQETFSAMQRIRETALINFNSLFTPDRQLWSLQNLRQFHALFVDRFDEGEGSFHEKWRKQLQGADDDTLQLAAELLYVQQFFTSRIGPDKKLENVKTVLAWCASPPPIPEWAIQGVKHGIAGDQSYNQHRPFHLAWLNEFLIYWQTLQESERKELLKDPWRFASTVRSVESSRGAYRPMQEGWLYIVFPESFESISSTRDKNRIRDAFSNRLKSGPTDNLDADLLEIRTQLTAQHGEGFHFYRSPIVEQWQKADVAHQNVEQRIRDQITRADILDAITALDRGEPHTFGPSTFYDLLEGGRRYPPKAVVGLAARRALGRPLRPDEFSGGQESWSFQLLRNLGFTIVDKERRSTDNQLPPISPPRVWIEDFKDVAYEHGGPGWEFGTCLWSPSAYENGADRYSLMREPKVDDLVIHVKDGIIVGWSYVSSSFRELAEEPPSPGPWAGRPSYYRIDLKGYQQFPNPISLDEFVEHNRSAIEEELKRDAPKWYLFILYGGREVRHAQGAYLTRCTPKLYSLIRTSVFNEDPTAPPEPMPPPIQPIYTVSDFSAESAIPSEIIETWRSRLERKKHLIFQGPPGTGKTYVAERLAKLLIAKTYGFVELVQFHPSYGYEDFMHGIRPVVQNGQMTFKRVLGRFVQFCERARTAQGDSPCVLIIDEINRANLSRVFGELMYLLEYRDKTIPLAGEETFFGIPPNVYIIGTMNTADRSIAVVDHALRRRFSFIYLAPDYDVLRNHLRRLGLAHDGLVKTLQAVNAAIDDRNYEIGISFFLKDGAALRTTLRDVWEGEIESYLEEYFYDQPAKVEALRWRTLANGLLSDWNVTP